MTVPKRKASNSGRFIVKRNKGIGGEKTWEDGTARQVAAHLAAEVAGEYMHSPGKPKGPIVPIESDAM